jgi:5-formyltetrahydrofolate cyclo-ligase
MNDEKRARINELARLSKGRTLSEAELSEQSILRQEYRDAMRANLVSQLSGYKIDKNVPPEKTGDTD